MADVSALAPFILQWEGGFVNNRDDRGGATNMGVTLGTWKAIGYDKDGDHDIDVDDLLMLTPDEVTDNVLKPHYWDRWKADHIKSQRLANILVDWVWCSGKWGIVIPQRLLYVKDDGIVGPHTLNAINTIDAGYFIEKVYEARKEFLKQIVHNDPSQEKFYRGWLRRLNELR